MFELALGETLTENVTTNDEITNLSAVSINILNPPLQGNLEMQADGTFDYSIFSCENETDAFTYEVCVAGCPDFCAEATVEIELDCDDLFIPDAFSPNDDGENDTWIIPGIFQYQRSKMVVVNRWGDIIFEAQPYLNDWDGTNMKGKAVPQGTYYFLLQTAVEQEQNYKGTITIIK